MPGPGESFDDFPFTSLIDGRIAPAFYLFSFHTFLIRSNYLDAGA
jgi:hypothetical protein